MASADLESRLVFSMVTKKQRIDLVVWSIKRKYVMLLKLIVLWEEIISNAGHWKETKYKKLVKLCTEKGWVTKFHHKAVGYINKKTFKTFRYHFRFSTPKLNQTIKDFQDLALRRED